MSWELKVGDKVVWQSVDLRDARRMQPYCRRMGAAREWEREERFGVCRDV